MTVAVTVNGAVVVATPSVAHAAPTKVAAKAAESRPDLVSASVAARASGRRVEVESLRSETDTTWVNPDGTLTTDAHSGQIRYRVGSGWRDVDLTLERRADGSVGPKGHPHVAGGRTATFSLDPAGRRLIATTSPTTGGAATRTVTRHYTDGSDNPGWVEETTTGSPVVTRYGESLGGDLGVTITGGVASLTLANLHGDVVATVALPASGNAAGIVGWSDYVEYGVARGALPSTGPLAYGWVGAKQRSGDTLGTGLILMGARIYAPKTGRFTSVDPVVGGNENAYNYPNDPVNMSDLDGRCGWCKRAWNGAKKVGSWINKHRVDIALTALSFAPGIGACGLIAPTV